MNFLLKKQVNQMKPQLFINNKIITFSTCWYIMKSKFTADKYFYWIKNLLSIVNNFNLVIYTDNESLKLILPLIDYTNKKIKIINKPITQFYTYKYKENWIKNHYTSNLDLHKIIDWKLNMLWNEKPFFVEETIKNKYFDSLYYGWCDIGYFRNDINDLNTVYLKKWPNHFTLLAQKFNEKIHYGCVQNNIIKYNELKNEIENHYKYGLKTPPTNKYNEICFAGGFFILTPKLISNYTELYNEKLQYYFTNNFFIKDDQNIIMDIIINNPSLFNIHKECTQYNNWFMFQRLLL